MNFQLDSFGSISDKLRLKIEEHGEIATFAKGDNIFDFDITLKYFFIILSGKIKIFQMNISSAKEQTIYLLGRGDMYDTVVLLDGESHDVMSEALESGEVLKLPVGMVREWMYDFPVFGEIILRYIAKQVRQTEELAADLTLLDTRERLIKLIVQNLQKSKATGKNMLENLSRTEIANLIGTVRHVVDRHIKQLKKEGIMESGRRKLMLKDMEKLKEKIDNVI
jgi:CRP-like cAMP-binding protein